jgi:hypothetical protein
LTTLLRIPIVQGRSSKVNTESKPRPLMPEFLNHGMKAARRRTK